MVVVSDLDKNFGGSTDLAKKRHGSADLHTPTHPPLHALDETADNATELSIYFPDTDVLVLAIRRYPEMCDWFSNNSLNNPKCNHKTAALPAFHALTVADNTGSFSAKRETDLLE